MEYAKLSLVLRRGQQRAAMLRSVLRPHGPMSFCRANGFNSSPKISCPKESYLQTKWPRQCREVGHWFKLSLVPATFLGLAVFTAPCNQPSQSKSSLQSFSSQLKPTNQSVSQSTNQLTITRQRQPAPFTPLSPLASPDRTQASSPPSPPVPTGAYGAYIAHSTQVQSKIRKMH